MPLNLNRPRDRETGQVFGPTKQAKTTRTRVSIHIFSKPPRTCRTQTPLFTHTGVTFDPGDDGFRKVTSSRKSALLTHWHLAASFMADIV
jgi:hypothetical protein